MTYSPETSPVDDELNAENQGYDSPNSSPEPRRRVRRRKRKGGVVRRVLKRFGIRRKISGIVIAVVSILLIATVIYAGLIVDSITRVNSSVANLERVLGGLSSLSSTTISLTDYERLQVAVSEARDNLELSQRRAFLIRPLSGIHPILDTAMKSLDTAKLLTEASGRILTGLQPSVFYLVSGDSSQTGVTQLSSGDRLVELLEIAHGEFNSAEALLAEARQLMNQMSLADVPLALLRTTERIGSFYEQLSSMNGILLNSSNLLNVVLGLNGDRTYLVLAVNNDELRPSGGFLGTWGWFQVRNGRIVEFDYSASTVNSPQPPSENMATSLQIPRWWIQFRQPIYAAWDGSWNASFPDTADMAMWYYNNGNNVHAPVDGTLSIDITGFRYLLDVLGEVVVPEFDVVVTSDNFRDLIYDIRAYSAGVEPHKEFVAAIYQQIMSEWQQASVDPQTNAQLLNAMLRGVQEKHIMIYLADDELDNAIDLLGWSGRQQSEPESDYLMVVDSNLSNKSSSSVVRDYTYDVDLHDDGTTSKRLTLSFDFPASLADNDPAVDPEFHGPLEYSTMVQVYGPDGSSLTQYPEDISFPTEDTLNGFWLVSTIFRIPYNDSRRIQYLYDSPVGYERFGNYGRYQLTIQKQPGTGADPITIQITLPLETEVVETSPPISAQFDLERPIVEYQLRLDTDQQIDLIFEFTG